LPNWIFVGDVPFVDTPRITIEKLLTQDGSPVARTTLVPLVVATSPGDVSKLVVLPTPENVLLVNVCPALRPKISVVASGSVNVRVRLDEGAVIVTTPPPSEPPLTTTDDMAYSYRMLMVPASKVSVPLTIVTLSAVRAADRVTDPAEYRVPAESLRPNVPLSTQVLLVMLTIVMIPFTTDAAATELLIIKPVEKAVTVAPVVMAAEPA
jgi:hypothetical protein